MIISLCGASSTGKTTIARRLANEAGYPLRSCGEIVKSKATLLGVRLDELSDELHQEIDNETRSWAVANDPCLVEGRYLDQVFVPIGPQVTLVRLVATHADRRARLMARSFRPPLTITEDELDFADSAFCARMYNSAEKLTPQLILNSSELSVEECVNRIRVLMRKAETPLG
jgi:cytidylate kinase